MFKLNRNNLMSYALASAILTLGSTATAAADSEGEFRYVGGKVGWAHVAGPAASDYPSATTSSVEPTDDGFRYVGGKVGWAHITGPSASDYPSVLASGVEPADDGFRYVGGKVGWVFTPGQPGTVSLAGHADTERDTES